MCTLASGGTGRGHGSLYSFTVMLRAGVLDLVVVHR
jgi:hypothetical protein